MTLLIRRLSTGLLADRTVLTTVAEDPDRVASFWETTGAVDARRSRSYHEGTCEYDHRHHHRIDPREGRAGAAVAQWVAEQAARPDATEFEVIDLKEFDVPRSDRAGAVRRRRNRRVRLGERAAVESGDRCLPRVS